MSLHIAAQILVIAGLGPAIHLLCETLYAKKMDPRVISASTRVFDALLPAGDLSAFNQCAGKMR
jgi:hypothetical protein